jgi:hypothetical protein
MTTVKQILDWPLEYKSGGFSLHIVTAKKRKKAGDKWIQRATLSDGQNEMLGSFVLKGNVPLPSNSPVQIKRCRRVELDVNNRAVQGIAVTEWELPTMTADEYENEQSDLAEEWKKDQDQRIRGMCRHGIVCAMIGTTTSDEAWPEVDMGRNREIIDRWVEYIVTGK